jgi:hypothetical protein
MRGLFFDAGWDLLVLLVLFLGMALTGIDGLNRLIGKVKSEERPPDSRFQRQSWGGNAGKSTC